MTQNTEQNSAFRTREEQVGAIANDWIATGMGRDIAYEWASEVVHEAEARGAEEQRRKDGELSRAKLFCQNEKEASDRTPERPDVVQWQKDRNEFFLSSTLEVVTEYAAWRDTKDGEARDTPSAYVLPDDFYNDEGDERCGLWSGDQIGKYTLPLYTRPANVAALESERDKWRLQAQYETDVAEVAIQKATALESRIAELKEAEQLARADAEASKARVTVLEAVLDGIKTYSEDTLAGPVGGGGDISWFKDGVEEAFRRARAALTREGGA